MSHFKKIILSVAITLLAITSTAAAESSSEQVENQYKYHYGVDMQFKLFKGLKLNIEPELRFLDGYDKLNLNGSLSYKCFKFIYLGASYRLEIDRVEDSMYATSMYASYSDRYNNDYYHRYAFDVAYKNDFGRFSPSLRVRYVAYTNDDMSDENTLRYRAKLEYNIKKSKVDPYISAELFQELEDNMLHKIRYCVGAEYKVSKRSSFGLDYKLDYFMLKYKNTHIFSLGYKHKF